MASNRLLATVVAGVAATALWQSPAHADDYYVPASLIKLHSNPNSIILIWSKHIPTDIPIGPTDPLTPNTGSDKNFSVKDFPSFVSLTNDQPSDWGHVTEYDFDYNEAIYPPYLNPTTGNAIPEPSSWALTALGFAGIGIMLKRRRLARPLA